MKTARTKLAAILLALAMVLTVMPVGVFAEGGEPAATATEETTAETTEATTAEVTEKTETTEEETETESSEAEEDPAEEETTAPTEETADPETAEVLATSEDIVALEVINGGDHTFDTVSGELTVNTSNATGTWMTNQSIPKLDVEKVTILEGVQTIAPSAFSDCNNLASVTIPDSVESIGTNAFYGTALTEVSIGSGVTVINPSAFDACENLTHVTFRGSTPPAITVSAFNGAPIETITVPADEGVVALYQERLESLNLADKVVPAGDTPPPALVTGEGYTFENGTLTITADGGETAWRGDTIDGKSGAELLNSVTAVIIDDAVTSIGTSAFYNCDNLTSITIPASVTDIGEMAFNDCGKLSEVVLGNNVASIGQRAFLDCTSLVEITFPASMTSIESEAFSGCTALEAITFPASVTDIGAAAFRDCTSLKTITFEGDEPPTIDVTAFYGASSIETVTVPAGKKAAYQGNLPSALDGKVVEADGGNGTDPAAPVPGGNGAITMGDVTANSVELNWTAATDDVTAAKDLQYTVLQLPNIIMVAYKAGMTSAVVTGLLPNTFYNFTVRVLDADDNTANYGVITVRTLADERLDGYNAADVAAMNRIIDTGLLSWTQNDPKNWSTAGNPSVTWTDNSEGSPEGKRLSGLTLTNSTLGDLDVSGFGALETLDITYSFLDSLTLPGGDKLTLTPKHTADGYCIVISFDLATRAISLEAQPSQEAIESGRRFAHWTGDYTGNTPQASFTIDGAMEVIANFAAADEYPVTVIGGTVISAPSGDQPVDVFPAGTIIVIELDETQTPKGTSFEKWTFDPEVSFWEDTDETMERTQFVMPAAPVTATATYAEAEKPEQPITVTAEESGPYYVGGTTGLIVTPLPFGSLTAVSSNSTVATVDGDGYVTFLSAGTATITVTRLENAEYKEASASITFTVSKKQAPVLTWPTAGNIKYGDALSKSALTGGSTEYGAFRWANSSTVPAGPDDYSYPVFFTPSASAAQEYDWSGVTLTQYVDVTVEKGTVGNAPLKYLDVKAGTAHTYEYDLSRLLPDVSPLEYGNVTYSIGSVNDTSDILAAAPNLGPVTSPLSIDVASVTASSASADIYVQVESDNFEPFGVTLKVSPTPQTPVSIFVTMKSGVYNGSPYEYTDLRVVDNMTGETVDAAPTVTYFSMLDPNIPLSSAPTDAGEYRLTLNVGNGYSGYEQFFFTIRPATVTVKADDKTVQVGGEMPILTSTVTGLGIADNLNEHPPVYNCDADLTVPGTYPITVSGAAVPNTTNYEPDIIYVDGVLTVTSAPPVDPDPVDPPTDNGGGSRDRGSSGSGSSSSGSSRGPSSASTAASNTPAAPVTTANAVGAANAAVAAAQSSGAPTATAKLTNPGDISLPALQAMDSATDMPLKLQADSTVGNAVDVRITLDPALATAALNLSASTGNAAAKQTAAHFEKFVSNKLAVVSFGQAGSFGQRVEVAAKVDLTSWDTKRLYFYAYDPKTNTYKRIEAPEYWIDANGYLHFKTELAGTIVISEGGLEKR